MSDTLADIRNEVLGWLRGDLDQDDDVEIVNAAINDAIEGIWMSMIQAKLNRFIGKDSPVSFNLAANTERVRLVSITDPVAGPVLNQIVQGILVQRTLNCAFTYVTESGSETLPSPTTQLIVLANNGLTAKLPNQANIAQAIGWNLYSSANPDTVLALQNQDPIPFGVTWQEPVAGVTEYPDAQQLVPIVNGTGDNISWIKHMEVRTSDTLLRPWNQSDIDSTMFRQFAGSLASASEYQTYAWDLINGNQLEVRPMTAQAVTPRYFYVAKPRRLRYDQAYIPYTEITGVHAYIVNKAVAKCKLALEEYIAHESWSGMAAEEESKIMKSLTQEDWSRNVRITPHMH